MPRLPVSLWLGFGLRLRAAGLWWGLVAGLVLVASFLILRVKQRESRDLARVIIDEQTRPKPDASQMLAE